MSWIFLSSSLIFSACLSSRSTVVLFDHRVCALMSKFTARFCSSSSSNMELARATRARICFLVLHRFAMNGRLGDEPLGDFKRS